MLKFVYVPATSAAQNRLLFFFFAAAVYSTNETNKAGLKQSITLDVYGSYTLFTTQRERDRKMYMSRIVIFIFKRNDGCLGTFWLSSK